MKMLVNEIWIHIIFTRCVSVETDQFIVLEALEMHYGSPL